MVRFRRELSCSFASCLQLLEGTPFGRWFLPGTDRWVCFWRGNESLSGDGLTMSAGARLFRGGASEATPHHIGVPGSFERLRPRRRPRRPGVPHMPLSASAGRGRVRRAAAGVRGRPLHCSGEIARPWPSGGVRPSACTSVASSKPKTNSSDPNR
jgi:hypothetical protein